MDAPFSVRSDSCFYISGDVQVHPSAAIAPGVLLQADSGSRLVIGPEVSIGAGALLHAQGGVLSLAARVTLGTRVLVMGRGRIGAGACVGSSATLLFEVAVDPGQLIKAESVLGEEAIWTEPIIAEATRQEETVFQTVVEKTAFEHNGAPSSTDDQPFDPAEPPSATSETQSSSADASVQPTPQSTRSTQVYGRMVVERLIRMMSPTQQPLDGSEDTSNPPPDE